MAFLLTKPLGRILLAGIVIVVLVLGWFFLQIDPIFAGKGREVIITVQSGDSFDAVSPSSAEKGVIASSFAFEVENFVLGAPVVRPGEYELRQGSSFSHVRAVLGAGPNIETVTALPGLTLHEIALNIESMKGVSYANKFAADAKAAMTPSPFGNGSSLEGLIGAKTYNITPSTTPRQLAHEMVTSFNKEAASVGLTTTTTVNGLDAYQLITMASIVQKEGYYNRYMGKVARVIYNRLARGGPLQMDSTVLYYLGKDGGTVTPPCSRPTRPTTPISTPVSPPHRSVPSLRRPSRACYTLLRVRGSTSR